MVQRGGRGDLIEVAGQIGQRLDLTDDVQSGAESLGQGGDEVDIAVQAEDLMPEAVQLRGEGALAGAEVENPLPLGANQPGGRGLGYGARRSRLMRKTLSRV